MPGRSTQVWIAAGGAASLLAASHLAHLNVPFFWDELGQFIPAALDIYDAGAWVPRSTLPNVHPPGVMAWLAGVWAVFGYGIGITRAAMLTLSLATLAAVYLMTRALEGPDRGAPALATVLTAACPLFQAQAIMAHLDMPAMLLTAAALWLFLTGRVRTSAAVCAALVLVKETGLVVPAVLAAWLLVDRRFREAAWFAGAPAALGCWLAVLWSATGHPLGNQEFAAYNTMYGLDPYRLAGTVLRRAWYLLGANFHWIGAAFVWLAWRSGMFRARSWRVAGSVAAAHLAAVTLLGGAALERYLLPALPVWYAAFATALWRLNRDRRKRLAAAAGFAAAMALSSFVDPPYPFPPENNRSWIDFAEVHREAARHLERTAGTAPILTAWPMTDALRRPALGYVERRQNVSALPDFTEKTVAGTRVAAGARLAVFPRTQNSTSGIMKFAGVRKYLAEHYGFHPQPDRKWIESHTPWRLDARFAKGGQWIEVYSVPAP